MIEKKMSKAQKRQKAIMNFLQIGKPLSLKSILSHFEEENFSVTQITIIRDLKKLEEKKHIKKIGIGKLAKYQINEQYSLLETVNIEEYFSRPAHKRNAHTSFSFSVFEGLQNTIFLPEEQEKLRNLQKKFTEKISQFSSSYSFQKEFERIAIEFSWKSSSIEGNTYSLLETERLLLEHKTSSGKTQNEAKMILNHKNIFDFVLNNRADFKKISRKKISEIHSMLTQDIGIAQNIRKTPVGITGSDYKPLDNQFQIEEALEKIIILINKKSDFFEQAFLLLLLISYLQAFEDGNKRTARMSANAVLLANNSCPLSYKTVEDIDYKKATLLFYEQNNLSALKKIFIDQFEEAVNGYF